MAEFKFKRSEKEPGIISESRIWETADGRVVEDGHPDAQSLIAGAGGRINPKTAARLGITERGVKEKKAAPVVVHSTAADVKPAKAEPEEEAPARVRRAEPEEEKPEPAPSKMLSSDTIKRGDRR